MSKFKVGDLVRSNGKWTYGITDEKVVLEVQPPLAKHSGYFVGKVALITGGGWCGEMFSLREDHFDLEKPALVPHMHREVIIAWANGEKIQWKRDGDWSTVTAAAMFSENLLYRVKPDNSAAVEEAKKDKAALAEAITSLSADLKEKTALIAELEK